MFGKIFFPMVPSFQLNHNDGAVRPRRTIVRTDQLSSEPGPTVEIPIDMTIIGLGKKVPMIIKEEDTLKIDF
jgi:hypothetical protein